MINPCSHITTSKLIYYLQNVFKNQNSHKCFKQYTNKFLYFLFWKSFLPKNMFLSFTFHSMFCWNSVRPLSIMGLKIVHFVNTKIIKLEIIIMV